MRFDAPVSIISDSGRGLRGVGVGWMGGWGAGGGGEVGGEGVGGGRLRGSFLSSVRHYRYVCLH